MPYIGVDLDAVEEFEVCGALAGNGAAAIAYGLLRLWRDCWRQKTEYVPRERLLAFFPGADEKKLVVALTSCRFLEAPPSRPDFRVRGAEKRLGILKHQSEAGKARARGKRDAGGRLVTAGAPAGDEPAAIQPPAGDDSSRKPALTASSQQPTANKEEDISGQENLLTVEEDESTSAVADVLTHYLKAMAANHFHARDTEDKRKLIRKRLAEGWKPDELKTAVDGLTWSDWHMGVDPKTKGKKYLTLDYAIGDTKTVERWLNEQRHREAS